MKLVSPVACKCKFVELKYYESAVGLQEVNCELPFFQRLVIIRGHYAQNCGISLPVTVRFRKPMGYECNLWTQSYS